VECGLAGLIGFGNARDDCDHKQWLVGSFRSSQTLLHSQRLEIKTSIHSQGEGRSRDAASADPDRRTLVILQAGSLEMNLEFDGQVQEVTLQPGDYVIWLPKVTHWWRALADNTHIITIRWHEQ
jgi:hypothetical protein